MCVVGALAMISMACSSEAASPGSAPETAVETTSTSLAATAATTAAEAPTTTTSAPARSFPELEQFWADQRRAIVDRAVVEGWGINEDNELHGPGGLIVDLDNCPPGWDPSAGVTPETVEIAFVGAINAGLGFFPFTVVTAPERIDRVNARGGIDGRDLSAPFREDGYVVQATVEGVHQVLTESQPLAVATFGGPPSIAAAELLEEACVPQLLPWTNTDALIDGAWSVPFGMTLGAEAALWGEVLAGLDGARPPRVAVVVMDNEFGWLMHDAFSHWVDHNPGVVGELIALPHDPASGILDEEIAEIVAAQSDVVIAATAGNPCFLLVDSAVIADLDLAARILPNYCTSGPAYLEPAGPMADGWLSIDAFNGGQQVSRVANPAWDSWLEAELTALQLDPAIDAYRAAMDYVWIQEQLLLLAGELPGGLNRPNVLLAMWAANFEHPSLGPTARWTVDGPADPVAIESGALRQWSAAANHWVDLRSLSLEGESPTCRWRNERCTFRPSD